MWSLCEWDPVKSSLYLSNYPDFFRQRKNTKNNSSNNQNIAQWSHYECEIIGREGIKIFSLDLMQKMKDGEHVARQLQQLAHTSKASVTVQATRRQWDVMAGGKVGTTRTFKEAS